MSFLEYRKYFSTTFNRFSGAGVNSDPGEFDSELWNSDED
jgi:hypothetical protein